MKSLILFALVSVSLNAFAEKLKYTNTSTVPMQLEKGSLIQKKINDQRPSDDNGKKVSPAKTIYVKGTYANENGDMVKMDVSYSHYSNQVQDYLTCEATIVLADDQTFTIENDGCEI